MFFRRVYVILKERIVYIFKTAVRKERVWEEMKKIEKNFYKTKYFHLTIFLLLAAIAMLEFLPFVCSNIQSGHDLKYHFGVIRALSLAWDKGNFFGELMEMIGGDYGYGTGLFYSTIPSGFCVVLMKTLHLSMIGSIYVEMVLLFSGSGMIVYCFLRRVVQDNRIAALGSIVYVIFPYFLWDVYVRFAFSEVFLMATLPMIVWGVYELLYRDNPAAFFALFISGYALSILLHFTMTVYVTLFLAVWLAIAYKKVCTKKNLFCFGISTCAVVLISASYLVPMLSNYMVTQTETMTRSSKTLWKNSFRGFGDFYLLTGFLYVVLVGVLFALQYVHTPKEKRSKGRLILAVLSGLLIVMYSPIFPWYALPKIMGMIQYPFRLMLIGGILTSLQVAILVKEKNFQRQSIDPEVESISSDVKICGCKSEKWKRISGLLCALLLVVNVIGMPFSLCRRVISTTRSEVPMASVSGYAEFDGLGVRKNGDYFPMGCTYDYAATRLNKDLIAETDVNVYELSDYRGLSQISFLVDCSGYAIVNIPYALVVDSKLYRFETAYTNHSLPITAYSHEGGKKTKLLFPDYERESKVILSYQNAPDFKAYLEENAFGVLTLEGDVVTSNLAKEYVGKYSLDVEVGENGGVLELPSYYYKGYTLTLQRADGTRVNLTPIHGRNGFIEVEINENGRLYVEYTLDGFAFSYVMTAIGIVGAVGLFTAACVIQAIVKRKEKTE